MTKHDRLRTELDAAVRSYDRSLAVDIALSAIEEGSLTIEDLYQMLSRTLVDVGAAWQRGTAEVWQEHLATGVVRTIVESCAQRIERDAPKDRTQTVVLAAPSEEYHDLGLRMLADRFTLAGWRTFFLGADVPPGEVIAAARELATDAIALSASTHYHRTKLFGYVEQIAAAHPGIRLWVGGPAFVHEHDGWPDEMILDPGSLPRLRGE